jgi:UDP-N-acetylglucosamine transferase subunit ALG13
MIFVTVGTNEAPFDRLLSAVANLSLTEELLVQHGSSSIKPLNATCVDFLLFDEVVESVRRARAVVSHAGVGSVLVALGAGKRPVVVPRLRRFGEAVDDHQLDFARRFEQAGLVTLVEDPDKLEDALAQVDAQERAASTGSTSLAGELRRYIEETLGHPVTAAVHG